MSVDPAVLTSAPGPLRHIDAASIRLLARLGSLEQHSTDDVLLHVNSAADRFHVVTEGRLRVGLTVLGKPRLTLQTLRPGDLGGLSWMWPPRRWQWDVTAQEPSSTVVFAAKDVLDHCRRDVAFRAAMFDVVAAEVHERLSHARLQLLDMYGVPSR